MHPPIKRIAEKGVPNRISISLFSSTYTSLLHRDDDKKKEEERIALRIPLPSATSKNRYDVRIGCKIEKISETTVINHGYT